MSLDFFRSMQQFVSVAKQLWHEFDEIRNLRLSMELVEIKKQRIQTLQLWTEWEKELRSDERDLHKHGKVANVLRARSFYCLKNWRRTSTGLTRNCIVNCGMDLNLLGMLHRREFSRQT